MHFDLKYLLNKNLKNNYLARRKTKVKTGEATIQGSIFVTDKLLDHRQIYFTLHQTLNLIFSLAVITLQRKVI